MRINIDMANQLEHFQARFFSVQFAVSLSMSAWPLMPSMADLAAPTSRLPAAAAAAISDALKVCSLLCKS